MAIFVCFHRIKWCKKLFFRSNTLKLQHVKGIVVTLVTVQIFLDDFVESN